MGRFSYGHALFKRAKELYERYDEVSNIKSERVAYDYIDMLAGFVKDTGISPRELVKLSPKRAFEVLKRMGRRQAELYQCGSLTRHLVCGQELP